MYDDRSQRWRQTIPPMPTATWLLGMVSFQSALVVAGGAIPSTFRSVSSYIEIFKANTSQGYRANQLPVGSCDISDSFVASGNTCYALGGYSQPAQFNHTPCAMLNDLLHTTVPASQTTPNVDTQSVWKTLCNTISFQPAAGVLTDKLLCIGGNKEIKEFGGNDVSKVYILYSPSTNSWLYISDLPVPQLSTKVAVVSPTEILVIGGLCKYSLQGYSDA